MLTLSTNCTCYLLPSHLPNSHLLDARTHYKLNLLLVTSHLRNTFSYPLDVRSQLSTEIFTCYVHTFPTHSATLSMLDLSINRTCNLLNSQLPNTFSYPLDPRSQYQLYLLPSHLPNSYLLDARSQCPLYLLLVNFTPSQRLHSRCSLSVTTVPVTCYLLPSQLPNTFCIMMCYDR